MRIRGLVKIGRPGLPNPSDEFQLVLRMISDQFHGMMQDLETALGQGMEVRRYSFVEDHNRKSSFAFVQESVQD